MKPGEAALLAGPEPEAPVTATAVYEVVLLAGSPTRVVLRLDADLERESLIEVDGERWLVADVRHGVDERAQLICIHADDGSPG